MMKINKKSILQLAILMGVLGLSACQVTTKRQPVETSSPVPVQTQEVEPELSVEPQEQPTAKPPVNSEVPLAKSVKVGLILGPGALHVYGHVGVLQELYRQRVPIHAIVGIESGALAAALFANKGLAYDVEWQMLKLKQSDLLKTSLLGQEITAGSVQSLKEFLQLSLNASRAESSKIAFGCPAYHLGKGQSFMMNRGAYVDLLGYCLAFPPLFRPYSQNVAGVQDIKSSVDFLKAKGAQFIIYVDVLGGKPTLQKANVDSQVLWSLAAAQLAKTEKGIDEVIKVSIENIDLIDFERRREMIEAGQKAVTDNFPRFAKKLGL